MTHTFYVALTLSGAVGPKIGAERIDWRTEAMDFNEVMDEDGLLTNMWHSLASSVLGYFFVMKDKSPKPECVTSQDGIKSWYLNGKLHREDGPAIEWPDGSKVWYLNGKCHR